ncbi:MAG: FtsX-like permease family protein, partial [Ruthenibacterium sp.]
YLENSSFYVVEDAGSRIDTATKSARTMSMLLISVALIVLTVGGIGIMNVLFVTIKERTREIGVLKALGCPAKEILMQFLLESVFIGVIGGVAGIMVSGIGLWLMQYFEMPLAPSLQGVCIAFLFAVFTSAAFGFYPAYQASRLKPVDALSYE